jgi:glycosyltransferase involved in cell wall biosynthesis
MTRTKISVVIPSLNEEKLISRTLSQFDADLKSKYNVEVIISDGGSTDDTMKIAEGKADKVTIHDNHIKQNIAQGRNAGAKLAEGDVLVFLNADTYLHDKIKFFETIMQFSSANHYSALAFPVKIEKELEMRKDKMFHTCYNNYVRLLNKIGLGMGRGECHIIKKEKFLEVNGYNGELAAGEDFDLYRRLRKNGKIRFVKDVIIYESPRRYRKFGYLSVFTDWAKNSISILFFNKSISKEWEPVR